jgi:hypothetical protein
MKVNNANDLFKYIFILFLTMLVFIFNLEVNADFIFN